MARRPSAIDLPIDGMSCAACASKIERTLNSLEGVEATVNYATEQATRPLRSGDGRARPTSSAPSRQPATTRGCRRRIPAGALRTRRADRRGAVAAGAAGLDDPGAAVRLLAVGRLAACDAGRAVGGLAVPPRGLAGPASWRGDDGHADQSRHARGLGLVGGCAVLSRCRQPGHADAVRRGALALGEQRPDLPRGRRPS